MRARSRGAVFVIAMGLVLAVAVPAGAQDRSAPAQQIVTAVARTSTLTMKSGFSQYLFVGGSSADALMTHTTFEHESTETCVETHPNTITGHKTQAPVGLSQPSVAKGSFTTSGNVAVIAGVGISGYSAQSILQYGDGENECGGVSPRQAFNFSLAFKTGSAGGVVLILVGTEGVGTLAPNLNDGTVGGQCNDVTGQGVTTLQNVTVSKGPNDGGAVGIFSAPVPPDTTCVLNLFGTSYNKQYYGFSGWGNAYLLVPTT
jgi:hypothetical protein